MSTFAGINTAYSALQAQRRGLELAGQNIANANTEGYTRQRIELAPVGAAVPARYALATPYGGGVTVSGVSRLNDAFLDSRGYVEHERQASLSSTAAVLTEVQRVFDEPSTTGLQSKLSQLWSGFTEVADNPGAPAARSQLLIRAEIVADGLNAAAGELSGQYADRRVELGSTATAINTAAHRLADLNGAVQRAEQSGASANELIDQRDLQALKLVELSGGTVVRAADGSAGVQLGGASLVAGTTTRDLVLTGSATLAGQAGSPATLRWADTGAVAGGAGGKAGAQLAGLTSTLPTAMARLDAVASALTSTVNAAHEAGYTTTGARGGAFYSGTTAATIQVAITDPAAVAASTSPTLSLDGGNADRLARLSTAVGGADDTYRTAVAIVGSQVQQAEQRSATQDVLTRQVDSARLSASGVSIDEELTSMLSFQRAYEAASRVMSAIDSMLDTLINRTGS